MHRPTPLAERIAARQKGARERAEALRRLVPDLAQRLVALGAHRVRLFGSLATGAEPHEGTDVDLCVEGLDEERTAEAALDLELAAGAPVDLVRWERASLRLRARVERDGIEVGHGPDDIAHVVKLRVAAELADDRATLDRRAAAIASLRAPAADERGEWMQSLALAFEVERYYTAVESMLARALRAVDGDLPTGPGSPGEILRAASVAIDGIRPALLSPESAAMLRELLKFRHLARHGYEIEPELARMVEHADRVGRLHPVLEGDWLSFEAWLKS